MLAEYLSIQLFRTRMGNVITEDIYIPETFNRNESLVNMVVQYFEQLGKVNLNEYEKQYIDILFASAAVQTVENANKVHMISEFEEKNSEYYTRFINDDTVFIHYTGITKPWHDWANYASADYFRNIYNISPWRNIPYKKAVKKHEYKEKYKHLLYQKKFLDGVFTAIKYNVMKG